MIGFSLVSTSDYKGIAHIYSPLSSKFIAFDQSNIESRLNELKAQSSVIFVNDARKIYRQLSFLNSDFLTSLPIFDNLAFLNVYKNLTDINLYQFAQKQLNVTIDDLYSQIKKVWTIQKADENWETIPLALIESYLEKDSESAYLFGEKLLEVKVKTQNLNLNSYFDFMQSFNVQMSKLEETGIVDRKTLKIVRPRYDYDRTKTGRLINTVPFCFQASSKKKFEEKFVSRFGKDGLIISADWRNADFRAAAALSKEQINENNKDPYTLLAKRILGKEDISEEERETTKSEVLGVMYGQEHKYSQIFYEIYPNIEMQKRKVLEYATKNLRVETPFGKVRFFSKGDNLKTKSFNSLCQMTVADLCKKAIIETTKSFQAAELKSVMIPIVIYDQFYFDILLSEKEEAMSLIKDCLTQKAIPTSFKKFSEFEIHFADIYGNTID